MSYCGGPFHTADTSKVDQLFNQSQMW